MSQYAEHRTISHEQIGPPLPGVYAGTAAGEPVHLVSVSELRAWATRLILEERARCDMVCTTHAQTDEEHARTGPSFSAAILLRSSPT